MRLSFDVTCPRCGGEVETANESTTGWSHRERKLVVSCRKKYCAWTGGMLHVELVDLACKRDRGAA